MCCITPTVLASTKSLFFVPELEGVACNHVQTCPLHFRD